MTKKAEVAAPERLANVAVLNELIWPEINRTTKPITLYTFHPDPSKVKPFVIKPGERIVFPKQVQFLKAIEKYDAVLYGGAVGAGKSHILRWALIWLLVKWAMPVEEGGLGLTGVEVGLFCETYAALEDRQISKLKAFPSWLGRYVGDKREFRLTPKFGGGAIKLRNLDDPTKYSSAEFGAIAIDELTFNPETTFNFLRSRRRWPPLEHCPIIAATNPGNVGHQWVFKRFVSEDRDKPSYDEELDYESKGHHFIQALPKDNPLLSKQYQADLKKLPEKLRRALVNGDWSVYAGQYFSMLDPNIHWIPPFEIPESWNRIRVIDQGGAHPSVCLWMAASPQGDVYVYRELSKVNTYASQFKRRIVQMSGEEKYRVTVGDPSMWHNDYSAEANKTPAEVYNDSKDGLGSLFMTKANNMRVQGWQALANAFSFEIENGPLYDFKPDGTPNITFVDGRRPKLYVFRTCPNTWSSLTNVQHDDVKVEDVKKTKGYYDPGQGDDEAECVRYGYLAVTPGSLERSPRAGERDNQFSRMFQEARRRMSPRYRTPNARY